MNERHVQPDFQAASNPLVYFAPQGYEVDQARTLAELWLVN